MNFVPTLQLFYPDMDRRKLSSFIQGSIRQLLKQVDIDTDDINSVDDDSDFEENSSSSNNNEVDLFALLKATQEYEKLIEDFEPAVVLAALISCQTKDLDRLTEWCYEEHAEKELQLILDKYSEESKKEMCVLSEGTSVPSFDKSCVVNQCSVQEVPLNDSYSIESEATPLSEQLAAVWTQFLDRAESLDIKEGLSFQLLAGCLEDLAAAAAPPQRQFLAQFTEGSPNLVVCAEAEMHVLALALYMHDPDKRLPGPDEVLICQQDTPLEQVPILFTERSKSYSISLVRSAVLAFWKT
jgi:hypothetical protein